MTSPNRPTSPTSPVSLEKFASINAELDARKRPREEVLKSAGVSAEAWSASQEFWLGRMALEAKRDKFLLSQRYTALFAERRAALERKPPAPAPRAAAVAAVAPSVPPPSMPAPPSMAPPVVPFAPPMAPRVNGYAAQAYPSASVVEEAPPPSLRAPVPPPPVHSVPAMPPVAVAPPPPPVHAPVPPSARAPMPPPPAAPLPASIPPPPAPMSTRSPAFAPAPPARAPAPPAAPAHPAVAHYVARLTLDQLAAMRAELAGAPESEHAAVRHRFGLDDSWPQEEAHWQRRLSEDKALFQTYVKRFQYFRALMAPRG